MLPTPRGSNPQPPDYQSDAHPTEPPRMANEYEDVHMTIWFALMVVVVVGSGVWRGRGVEKVKIIFSNMDMYNIKSIHAPLG